MDECVLYSTAHENDDDYLHIDTKTLPAIMVYARMLSHEKKKYRDLF